MVFYPKFLLLGLIEMCSFFVEGSAGFGSAVIAAPFYTSMLGTESGVPFGTTMSVFFVVGLTIVARKNISWKDLAKILLACLPGLFLGQYLFRIIDPTYAKVGIGFSVTIIALLKIYQNIIAPLVLKKEVVEDAPDTVGKKIFRYTCLIAGGIVHGAFNIGGPLVTVYTLEAVKDKERFRNTMICLWAILDCINMFSQFRAGMWTPLMWSAILVCLPFALVGFVAGVKFTNRIPKEKFLRFVFIVLLAVGLNMFIRSLIAVL